MDRETERQAAQIAFIESGVELRVGDATALPLPRERLLALDAEAPEVHESFRGGLTGYVYRVAAGGDWSVKRARSASLVQNVDGQTSFLNEIQRRSEFEELGDDCPAGVARTRYASLRDRVIVSPWIPGAPPSSWDARKLESLFGLLTELALRGFFEWDVSPGNLVDDGKRIWMFDFGYMYRFDPLSEFNPNGIVAPLFHPAERFETRTFFACLLEIEKREGLDAALELFRLEKRIALSAYERLRSGLQERGASALVLDWYEAIIERWRSALAGDLATLYFVEAWRSHRLDLDDDLRGKTCTRRTLARADWLIAAARDHFDALQQGQALFWHDGGSSREALLERLQADRALALRFQVQGN